MFSFTGTIRENIDPFEQYSDSQVWDALGKRRPAGCSQHRFYLD
jgi:ABC-type multidrug transport system fused ATPase/permease subunit